jgi:hypothetical protein
LRIRCAVSEAVDHGWDGGCESAAS